MNKNNKVVLKLMTEKGYEFLKSILKYKKLISFVVIGRDKNVDEDFSEIISNLCIGSKIPYFYRGSEPKIDEEIFVMAVSWRWLINHPVKKLIVFHDSLLPKYRGFSPLVNMLINGEKEIGVSAIFGSKEYDRGEIISQESTLISYPIKIKQAIEINNLNFKKLILNIIEKINSNEDIISYPQNESDASYSVWRDSNDYYINWNESSDQIKRLIDAVGSPYLGARSKLNNGSEILIKDAEIYKDLDIEIRHIGKVILVEEGFPIIICGKGLLKITEALYINSDYESPLLPFKKFRVRFL